MTGDLLSWDQNGYAATKTRTGFLTFLPWIGDSLLKIAIGGPGPALGSLSLTRFFAMHVGLFGGGFLLLLIIRGVLARRANAKIAEGGNGSCTVAPHWPAQAWRGAVACLVVMVVVLLLACQHGFEPPHAGAPLLSPADTDPSNAYDAARPEWFLAGVYEFSHLFPGRWGIVPIFIVPGLLLVIVLAMPFLGKHCDRPGLQRALHRAVAGGRGLADVLLLRERPRRPGPSAGDRRRTLAGRPRLRVDPPQPGHPAGRRLEPVAKTIRRPKARGCSPSSAPVATTITRQAMAKTSFKTSQTKSRRRRISPASPAARWLAGLLDPKQISGPNYFGGTKLRGGEMPGFVKETFSDLDAEQKKDLAKVVMALSAEAHLPSQKTARCQRRQGDRSRAASSSPTISAAPTATSSTTRARWARPPS